MLRSDNVNGPRRPSPHHMVRRVQLDRVNVLLHHVRLGVLRPRRLRHRTDRRHHRSGDRQSLLTAPRHLRLAVVLRLSSKHRVSLRQCVPRHHVYRTSRHRRDHQCNPQRSHHVLRHRARPDSSLARGTPRPHAHHDVLASLHVLTPSM